MDVWFSIGTWLIQQSYTVRGNWPFLSQQLTIADHSTGRRGIVCPVPFHSGIWIGLGYHKFEHAVATIVSLYVQLLCWVHVIISM